LSSNTGFACLRCKNLGKNLFYCKRAHANTRWFNDGEMSGPIAARLVPTSATGGIGNRSNTMPEDAGRPARQASSPKSLSKVSTMRVSRGPCQYVFVFDSRRGDTNPNNVMAGCFQLSHGIARKIFVCEEAHLYTALGYTFSDLSTSRA
jgi:hypothetical protein